MTVFHKLCRIAQSSRAHRTKWVTPHKVDGSVFDKVGPEIATMTKVVSKEN